MKNKVLVNGSAVIKSIYDFALTELKSNSRSNIKKSRAEAFFNENFASYKPKAKKKIVDDLTVFSFYDISNYSGVKNVDSVLYTQMEVLTNFKYDLISFLTGDVKEESTPITPFVHKVSPPLQAYDYVGNNKLNITHSKRSYGLLFE